MKEGNLVITEYFSQIVHRFSNRVCLQIKKDSKWERWTYGQLEERALKIAGFLIAEKALKKGDFVALILENRPEWPAIYLGIARAGLSCVPLDPQLSLDEIKNLILDSGAKIVFTSCEIFAQKVKQAIEGTNTEAAVLETDEIKIKNASYEDINWPQVFPEDIAFL
ncbi:MAG: AMP-binding protein, partial [Candidatus Omnitrophota bacterium]|nr:AMP-binding protein [Candidatus Omnitrophota bacterium]